MKRSLLMVLVSSMLLLFAASASAAPSSRAFKVFEHRVCRGVERQERQAAPALTRFNDLFYNGNQEPEELEAAGREYRKVNDIWSRWAQRLLAIPAPADQARLWQRYGREENVILGLGYQLAEALEAADLPTFNQVEKRNVRLQIKRNQTWTRIGLFCD